MVTHHACHNAATIALYDICIIFFVVFPLFFLNILTHYEISDIDLTISQFPVLPLISRRSMLWEHTRTKPSSFKRTHSNQFKKSLSSSLRLVFLYFWHIFLSWAPQTLIDSSQVPFQLFPVPAHHIQCSSFKRTHSRLFQSWPSSALW